MPLILEQVDALPYGLELRTPVRLGHGLDLTGAADKLLESLRDTRSPRSEGPHVAATRLGPLLRQLDLLDPGVAAEISRRALSYFWTTARTCHRTTCPPFPARRTTGASRPAPIVDAPSRRRHTRRCCAGSAESRMVCEPPAHEPWLHGLGEEGTRPGELTA